MLQLELHAIQMVGRSSHLGHSSEFPSFVLDDFRAIFAKALQLEPGC